MRLKRKQGSIYVCHKTYAKIQTNKTFQASILPYEIHVHNVQTKTMINMKNDYTVGLPMKELSTKYQITTIYKKRFIFAIRITKQTYEDRHTV